ncbi:MAG: zinc-ribbon and FHA domain-containing protein [Actinomycetota bacterium]|jgi:pSer/pThr/pTyr-binding forkhead associated (FHA) protein|nr:zinc-ribbon and FHA domain-containing protein [Actinomycetota bacterium]
MDEVFCNQCGHANPDDANFCSSCGAPLDVRGQDHTITLAPVDPETGPPSEEVTVAVDELPEGSGMLVVKRGPGAGSRFVLDKAVVSAGRHPRSDIFLDDVTVSRRHAELVARPGGYLLRDAGSLNGTYLNRERIEEAPVSNGDEIQIGRFKLVFLDTSTPTEAE